MSLSAVLTAAAFASAGPPPTSGCANGAYRAPDGQLATLVQVDRSQHYTLLSGPRGDLAASDARLKCSDGVLKGLDGEIWSKLTFRSVDVDFQSHGVTLHGVLLVPGRAGPKPPLVVLVSGSEKTSPNGSTNQQMFTAQGVATFAYDKRGTARSQGVYTQDFDLLADDAAAATRAAERACRHCFARVGLAGGSQGGWIAPLAALRAKADFVEVGFGVVGTALEQDQWQVDYQLQELGFEPGAAVHEVTDATAKVAASNFTEGLSALQVLRQRVAAEPWFGKLDGQYTGELMRGEVERARSESPGVPWHYDGQAVLRKLKIPQLWVFAGDDSVAPSAPSIVRLNTLRREGVDATIVVYPHTDHGITTFITDPSGQRRRTGIADGYLRLIADWAKASFNPPYGQAVWESSMSAGER